MAKKGTEEKKGERDGGEMSKGASAKCKLQIVANEIVYDTFKKQKYFEQMKDGFRIETKEMIM